MRILTKLFAKSGWTLAENVKKFEPFYFCGVHTYGTNDFAVRLGLAERFCSWRGPDSDPQVARHTSERLGEGV